MGSVARLLGNEDGVKIPLGSALPVGNSYKSFQCMVHDIHIFKENCYLFCIFLKRGKGLQMTH